MPMTRKTRLRRRMVDALLAVRDAYALPADVPPETVRAFGLPHSPHRHRWLARVLSRHGLLLVYRGETPVLTTATVAQPVRRP